MITKNFEFDITYECNLSCKWCERLCGTKFRKPDVITPKMMRKYCDIINPYITSHSRITILGGEPTLHPQLFEVLDIALEMLRPKLAIPIYILSNGSGSKINSILDQIRVKYVTQDNLLLAHGFLDYAILKDSTDQFCIVCSKTKEGNQWAETHHLPIYAAPIDYPSNILNYSEDCPCRRYCGYGVTPYGIYICSTGAPAIPSIFKLGNGWDHFPTPREEEEQAQKFCKYCYFSCYTHIPQYQYDSNQKKMIVTESYKKAIEEWNNVPYFLEPLETSD